MGEKEKADKKPTPSLEELISEIDRETIGKGAESYPLQSELTEKIPTRLKGGKYQQYIRFFLENILLAIPISSALEISRKPDITPLPNLPDWILGVSNIRGEIISIVDLKIFFRLPLQTNHSGTKKMVIIVRDQEIKLGIVVDSVMGIFSPERIGAEIQKSPYKEEDSDNSEIGELVFYISGIVHLGTSAGEFLLNILDIDKLLGSPRIRLIQ